MSRDCETFYGIGSTHLATHSYVYHKPSNRLYSAVGPALNRHALQDVDYTSRLLQSFTTLHRLASKDGIDLRKIRGNVTIALPGVALASQQRSATQSSRMVFPPDTFGMTMLDDTWACLFAETYSQDGISAIAGIGASVCIAQEGFRFNERYKMDGWGPVIGDFGSAFDVSVEYFRRLNRKKDATPVVSCGIFPMISTLFSQTQFRITTPTNIQNWADGVAATIGSEWRGVFSLTAKAIAEAADRPLGPIPEANELIHSAAAAFSDTILSAIARSNSLDMKPHSVVLFGELCSWSSHYTNTVQSIVHGRTGVHVNKSQFGPAIGALLWSYANLRQAEPDPERITISQQIVPQDLDGLRLMATHQRPSTTHWPFP